jgi:hypothetical protein
MVARTWAAACLLCILAGVSLASVAFAEDDYSEKLSDAEKGLLAAINKERRAQRATELKVNGKLMAAARIHARNMAAAGSGGHVLKDVRAEWRTPEDRIKHVEYRSFGWAENVAWGYPRPEQVTAGWMTSEGHRRNMLSGDYDEIGIATTRGASGPYWCAVFGRSSPPTGRPAAGEPGEGRSAAGQSAPSTATRPSSEDWRYRWHQGRWWYWLPSNEWVVWVDGQWVKPR